MNAYAAGKLITLSVSYDDLTVYEPVAGVRYRVLSQSDAVLLEETDVSEENLGEEGFSIEIPASLNLLEEGTTRAVRMVDLQVKTGSGTYSRSVEYIIEADTVLQAGVNSYVGYGDAVMIGYDIPALTGWNEVDKSTRISALLFAKRIIGRLNFVHPETRKPIDVNTNWGDVPFELQDALARAQVIEANEVCGGDPVIEYRRRGIQSITVGESKNFFQSWKPADERVIATMGISPNTAKELKPYLAPQTYRVRRG